VQGGAQERPLRGHGLQAPDRPAAKSVVVLELGKAALDDFAPLLIKQPGWRLLQTGAHFLHHRGVGPDFDWPAFGVARAERAHRTVAVMTAEALDNLAFLVALAFVIERALFRTGDGVAGGVIMKLGRRVGPAWAGRTLGRGNPDRRRRHFPPPL
jgi:hypothetical protein